MKDSLVKQKMAEQKQRKKERITSERVREQKRQIAESKWIAAECRKISRRLNAALLKGLDSDHEYASINIPSKVCDVLSGWDYTWGDGMIELVGVEKFKNPLKALAKKYKKQNITLELHTEHTQRSHGSDGIDMYWPPRISLSWGKD